MAARLLALLASLLLALPGNALASRRPDAGAADPRDLAAGMIIGDILGLRRWPNCLVRRDGAWLCTVTVGAGAEGSSGEKVDDAVKGSGNDVVPAGRRGALPAGRELQHAYSTLFQGAGDSVWLTYVMNDRNVTPLDGGHAARQDMLGHFFLRRSLDGSHVGGAADRWPIPVRETLIDRQNSGAPCR